MTDDQEMVTDASELTSAAPPPTPPIEIPAPSAPARRGVNAWLVAIPALIAVIVLAIFLGLAESNLSGDHSLDSARTAVLAAARVDAAELTSYDYRDLPAHFKDVEGRADAKFAKQFSGTSSALEKALTQYHAVARGQILDASILSVSATRAQVMLFVNQVVTNSQVTTPTTDTARILLTLVHPGSVWLLDDLKVV